MSNIYNLFNNISFYIIRQLFLSKYCINNLHTRILRITCKMSSNDSKFYSNKNDNSYSSDSGNRPPKHLRGKAIGLWYARRSKQRKLANEDPSNKYKDKIAREDQMPIGKICLTHKRKEDILYYLSTHEDTNYKAKNIHFKQKYLEVANGKFENMTTNILTQIDRDEKLDKLLLEEQLNKMSNNGKYKEFIKIRQKLPCYDKLDDILNAIWNNQVTLISGETGCGKTTQIPQYILDKFILDGNGSQAKIICTQPRRISALTVCERVADERAEKVGGGSIGYQIRLEKRLPSEKGSITFCTTGVVLRKMENDSFLQNISHIILDEIHERDILCDFLITLLKNILPKRPDLKLILMSATFNSQSFANYFDNKCAQITVPGFTFPVTEYYLEDVIKLTKHRFPPCKKRNQKSNEHSKEYDDFIGPYIRQIRDFKRYPNYVIDELMNPNSEELDLILVLNLLTEICKMEEGAILVFLPGFGDISKLCRMLESSHKFPSYLYRIYPLHSKLPTVQQKEIFDVPPKGIRKIIIATNIAETSITINDVVYVVDCGKIKIKNYCAEKNLDSLNPEWVSMANADQRRGRAGRVRPGICYHLFTRVRKQILEKQQKPEILRERLESVILMMKKLQLGKAEEFLSKLMDPPSTIAIRKSLSVLRTMDALDNYEKLTPLGYLLATLPMNPQMGKMLLLGAFFSCLDPILSVAASLDFKDAFQTPLGKEKEAKEKRKSLLPNSLSDHLLLHEALNQYIEARKFNQHKQFCWEYFLSSSTLSLLHDMKKQLAEHLRDLNFISNNNFKSEEWNFNSDNEALVKAVIAAGLFPNVAVMKKNHRHCQVIKTIEKERVNIVPGSVCATDPNIFSPLFVYFLKLESSGKIWLHDTSNVHPVPLLFFGDNLKLERNDEEFIIGMDTEMPLRFRCSEEIADLIINLRKKFNDILEWKISNPAVFDWRSDTNEIKILKAVTRLISSEETVFSKTLR